MKYFIYALKVFGYIWVTLSFIVILVSLAFVWMKSGFSAVQEIMSPYNLINFIVTAITLAPGIAALMWADKLSHKASSPNNAL